MKANLFATILALGLLPSVPAAAVTVTTTRTFDFVVLGDLLVPTTVRFGIGIHENPFTVVDPRVEEQDFRVVGELTTGLGSDTFETHVYNYSSQCPFPTCFQVGIAEVNDQFRFIHVLLSTFGPKETSVSLIYSGLTLISTPLPAALPSFASVLGIGAWFARRRYVAGKVT